jgi:hypothetical protein
MVAQLAAADMALSSWQQRARLTLQDNKVIHKPRRHTEMPRWSCPQKTGHAQV